MTDPARLELLEGHGSSLIVGVVAPDGEPFATRCWGLRAVGDDPLRLRVLLAAGSMARIGRTADDPSPFAIAITSADVETLASVQVKGTARDLEAATAEDLERYAAYQAGFLAVINRVDGYDLELLSRWAPVDLVACTVEVADLFDQTPGPGAGARLGGAA